MQYMLTVIWSDRLLTCVSHAYAIELCISFSPFAGQDSANATLPILFGLVTSMDVCAYPARKHNTPHMDVCCVL